MPPFTSLVLGVAAGVVCVYAACLRRRLSRAEARAQELALGRDKEIAAASESDKLLRAIVETTPSALVVFGQAGTITFTNAAARELFFDGVQVEG
jgi:PAS domain-containing protein